MVKVLLAEHVHAVIGKTRVEHVGEKQRVLDRPHGDAESA